MRTLMQPPEPAGPSRVPASAPDPHATAPRPAAPRSYDPGQTPALPKPQAAAASIPTAARQADTTPLTPPLPCSSTTTAPQPSTLAYTASMWGVGVSHDSDKVAEAETFSDVEGNMCRAAMRDSDPLLGSGATSRMQGTRRNLEDLPPGRAATSRTGPHREGGEP